MKRIIIIFATLCLIAITLFTAVGCGDEPKPPLKYYTLNFVGEKVDIEPQSIAYGKYATAPENPEREGYCFAGWFTDNTTFANEWDFKTNIVTQDTTLYAKWEKNTLLEINLQGTKWKLIGIVDIQTGVLTELEPRDCNECYTITFDTDGTFSGVTSNNVINYANYVIDYNTEMFYITDIVGTEMGEEGNGYLYSQILWKIQSFKVWEVQSKVKGTCLYLYYNESNNYLKYKKIGG